MKIYVMIIKSVVQNILLFCFTSWKGQQEDLFEWKSKKKIPQFADVFEESVYHINLQHVDTHSLKNDYKRNHPIV